MAGRRYDPSRWKELKAAVRLPRILEAIGHLSQFRVRGRRLIGPCPIHGGDNSHAFVIDQERDLWFCHTRCGVGGDSIRLAWELSGRSWVRTADWLTILAGQPTPVQAVEQITRGARSPIPERRPFRPFTRRLQLNPAHPFFRRMGLRVPTLALFEAGGWHGKGFLEGMVAVRLHDLEERPLGYAGRRLDPAQVEQYGKWKWPCGYPKGELLYNWHRALPYSECGLIVVEGAWSVMKLRQAGIKNVVALGGLSVTPVQRTLLSQTKRLLILMDGDAAGEKAAQRMIRSDLHPKILVVTCPRGRDPAELPETELLQILSTPMR